MQAGWNDEAWYQNEAARAAERAVEIEAEEAQERELNEKLRAEQATFFRSRRKKTLLDGIQSVESRGRIK